MARLAIRLGERGYDVVNVGYPSREAPIEALAREALAPALHGALADPCRPVHFVTHSLGGILLRYYLWESGGARAGRLERGNPLGRVVMLAPPNQGSEVVDRLRALGVYRVALGPAGQQLGTDPASVPSALNREGPVTYPVGVIAGQRTLNPLLSALISGPNDGKVALARARVEGMADFLVVRRSHTFIMVAEDVIAQCVHFLEHGRFAR
jgi:hypothetical protein